MAISNGGIIGPDNIPTGKLGTASGVWKLNDATDYIDQGLWPVVTGLSVPNSCRFNPGSSDTLSKTLSTPTNNKEFTFSFWFKKCENGREQHIVNGGSASSQFYFNSSDQLYFYDQTAGGTYKTTQVFRDVSAWYHIVVAEDTTQGTASSRIRIYVNGSEITDFAIETDPTQNNASAYNTAATYTIGTYAVSPSGYYLNGYLAEFVFIDGQQLTPTSFGEFDTTTPTNWKPIDVSGLTYGNNGFYLPFQNSAALGQDDSGNGNNFTVNNLTSIDQTTDTPTNNFATMNPLDNFYAASTFSEGNLRVVTSSGNYTWNTSTIGASAGKYYCEVKVVSTVPSANQNMIGISNTTSTSTTANLGSGLYGWGYHGNGTVYNNGSSSAYGSTYTTNDIISIALDLTNSKLYYAKNGTWQNSGDPTSGSTGTGALSITATSSNITGNYFIACGDYDNAGGCTLDINFGNPPFAISSGNTDANSFGDFEYAVPSGYYALNTKNLTLYG